MAAPSVRAPARRLTLAWARAATRSRSRRRIPPVTRAPPLPSPGLSNTTALPTPTITSKPANPTTQTSASFSFTDSQNGVSFLCQLDGSAFSACSSPQTYSGLGEGSHTFSLKAQDTAGNQSAAATFTWTVDPTPPATPIITSTPVTRRSRLRPNLGLLMLRRA